MQRTSDGEELVKMQSSLRRQYGMAEEEEEGGHLLSDADRQASAGAARSSCPVPVPKLGSPDPGSR